jgi:hypothetical protein
MHLRRHSNLVVTVYFGALPVAFVLVRWLRGG